MSVIPKTVLCASTICSSWAALAGDEKSLCTLTNNIAKEENATAQILTIEYTPGS